MFAQSTGVSSAARNNVEVEALFHTSTMRVGKLGISENQDMGSIMLLLGVFKYFL